MKRAKSRSLFPIAAIIFSAAAAATASIRAQRQSRGHKHQRPCRAAKPEPSTSQAPQKASGIVPPGVKLSPEMPAAGAPRTFEFPKAVRKPCLTACAFLLSPITANRPSPRGW